MAKDNSIVLANPQRGIAPSPHLGVADIRNCDIYSEPGVLKINEKAQAITNQQDVSTFTADASTDVITTASNYSPDREDPDAPDDEVVLGRAVTLTTTGTLPAGLALSTTYFLISVNGITTFKLATTYALAAAGTAVDITDTGTGTHTMSSLEMGIPVHETTDSETGFSFIVDNNGRVWYTPGSNVWRLLEGNTRTGGTGNGIVSAYDHLFVFRDDEIDVMVISTKAWTNGWKAASDGMVGTTYHKTFIKDDIIYFGNGRYVGTIEELTTFVPGTPATYSFSATTLDLPKGYIVGPLAELGSKLWVAATRANLSRVFPWSTDPTESYDGDFPVPGITVRDMLNVLNTVYIASGDDGCIYSSVGTAAYLFVKIPGHISGVPGTSSFAKITQLQYFHDRLYFGLNCHFFNGATYEGASGVWSVVIATRKLTLENSISTTTYGSTSGVEIPLLHKPTDNILHIGWSNLDNSTKGVDSLGSMIFRYVTASYGSYIIFDLIRTGNIKNPFTPTEILFQLTQALVSSLGVRLSYRKNMSASFTTIGTFDFTTIGGVLSWFADSNITLAEVVQIKAELTTSSQYYTPKLHSIILS